MIPTSKLSEIYQELSENNVLLFSGKYNFDCGSDATIICVAGQYGFFLDIERIKTVRDENMAVGHEWGHFVTGSTYLVGANKGLANWCEGKADRAQIRKLVPFDELRDAIVKDKMNIFELSEHFDVTEDFIRRAVNYYTNEKGLSLVYCDEFI